MWTRTNQKIFIMNVIEPLICLTKCAWLSRLKTEPLMNIHKIYKHISNPNEGYLNVEAEVRSKQWHHCSFAAPFQEGP